ncbi:MAG: putative YccA/Bax inhibitor family protein [Planctomycetota bacterium]|jgi:uncharacterized YccA/Bax inhibitor family protein
MRTSNPYLKEKALTRARQAATDTGTVMTVEGTVNKISLLLLVLAISATASWSMVTSGSLDMGSAMPVMIGGGIGAFVLSIVVSFKPQLARTLAVPFAVAEGLLLGVISAMYQFASYPGIVLHAVLLTMGTALAMFLLWRTGVIKVTNRMRSVVCAAMGGIVLVYLMSFVMGMFGVAVPMIHGNGIVGIGFSVVVLLVVSFMLLIDFDMIERMANSGQPKSMEWFGAFALLVTLVWLYMEFLRLLSKLKNR